MMENTERSKECILDGKLDGRYALNSRIYDAEGVSPAMSVGGDPPKIVAESDNLRIRVLTPREYFRLMGFSDEAFDRASSVCSKTQLYKQAGNSIVVNVLEAIFRELYLTEQKPVKMNKLEDYL